MNKDKLHMLIKQADLILQKVISDMQSECENRQSNLDDISEAKDLIIAAELILSEIRITKINNS